MAAGADRDKSSPPSPDEPRAPGGQVESAERFGPLAVTRHVKDDGRALLLYTRRRDANDDSDDDGDDSGNAVGGGPA